MASIRQQVRSADDVITRHLSSSDPSDRGFLSQDILSQLRNLTEGLIVWSSRGDGGEEFHYDEVSPALAHVRGRAHLRILARFHDQLQASVSHYTLDGDPSERLMLKYYAFLIQIRDLAKREFSVDLLRNLERFPVDIDPSLSEYHEKIAHEIDSLRRAGGGSGRHDRYYIQGVRPFVTEGRVYYEVTFYPAHNKTTKFDRIIGFTDVDMTSHYAASLELAEGAITVLGRTMPIVLIAQWQVSIRPCEFNNFVRFFGPSDQVQTSHSEYRNLMDYLTQMRANLLEIVDMSDSDYSDFRTHILRGAKRDSIIFSMLDRARLIIRAGNGGARVLRYLMLRMDNNVIRAQFDSTENTWLSNLRLSSACRPFDRMPLCTSPRKHNPRFHDLVESIGTKGRQHEILARRIRSEVEQRGSIYTPESEVEGFGDLAPLISEYNRLLPPTSRHAPRKLKFENGHVFMVGYEDAAAQIIKKLQAIAGTGVADHDVDVQEWLSQNPKVIDDELKAEALRGLFSESKVALVYGAAGTGKSTMVHHIAKYFEAESKLFLAHTNPAIDNLKRNIEVDNANFSTIASHLRSDFSRSRHYDVLVIDECSIVSNAALLSILEGTSFDLLVLVGDVYQIEAIEFGNWFSIVRSYLSEHSVFELTQPFRTSDPQLLTLWDRVRKLDDRIEESLSKNGYSEVLGDSLFERRIHDEIILCLNYDGLYGINNVNRFLQAGNTNPLVRWGDSTFKIGDPILFNEIERFRPVIFNNLKGEIVDIRPGKGVITFAVNLDRDFDSNDLYGTELRWIKDSIVEFDVYQRGNTDDDDDGVNTIVPFQIAYAVSIHKAQGLEYDSVKVVITDANEERVSHSIFYTAITRARQQLKVYWTPETQTRILGRLEVRENAKDEALLKVRTGITPVASRPRRNASRGLPMAT